ncbi:hypothetical protein [Clostridium niameyense]|uniref:hypothetical protein n=1 Tax=Clostridium niameyense TaxID=1622073 RepID=UPI000ADFDDF3|nr:hypothetical protein [Clostridium niameyense]
MEKKFSNYDADYVYKKDTITYGKSYKGYPILERTVNGLLFPEGPQDNLEFKDMK